MACIARQGDPPRQYASPEESLVISDPKAPGIIKLGGRGLENGHRVAYLPFGRRYRCDGPYSLSRPIGTQSWLRTSGSRRRGTTIWTWVHDHCKATPTARAR
jgi:hypothetical protein